MRSGKLPLTSAVVAITFAAILLTSYEALNNVGGRLDSRRGTAPRLASCCSSDRDPTDDDNGDGSGDLIADVANDGTTPFNLPAPVSANAWGLQAIAQTPVALHCQSNC